MTDGGNALDQALGELARLGSERDARQLSALRERLADSRLRVLVAGEAKRASRR
jgi:hypothetical protein